MAKFHVCVGGLGRPVLGVQSWAIGGLPAPTSMDDGPNEENNGDEHGRAQGKPAGIGADVA